MSLNINALMIFVGLLCLIGCILQGTFITVEHKEKYVAAVVLKGLAAVVFCIVGLYGQLLHNFAMLEISDNNPVKYKVVELVVKGLFLGALGDILLNLRFVFNKHGQMFFLAGIAAFLAGHIIYLCSLIMLSKNILVCVIVGAVLAAILLTIIFKSFEVKLAFKIFGVLYIGAVCLMAVFAVVNAIDFGFSTFSLVYAIGAVLFLVSDVVLIFNTFGPQQKFSLRITNLSLYYIGQLLIALSVYLIK